MRPGKPSTMLIWVLAPANRSVGTVVTIHSVRDALDVDQPVVIIGGGIGGLTAALCLVGQDIPCVVYEQAPELREIGAAVALWPAPLQVFDRLGIGMQVRALSGHWQLGGLRRADGRFLVHYTARQFAAQLGEPLVGVHRGELQALLLAALPPGIIMTGRRCVEVHQPADGVVEASFEDGTSVQGRALIAADGQHSLMRTALFGRDRMHDCKYLGWRGIAPQPPGSHWDLFAGESWGPGGRFGILPISAQRVSWYAATPTILSRNKQAELLQRFGAWHDPIAPLLHATPKDLIWCDEINDLWPLRRWSVELVTLLGDAAHPMTPELGQGACQAILDAWALGRSLATEPEAATAIRHYEHSRRPRARFVTVVARLAAAVGAADHALTRALRAQSMQLTPAPLFLRTLRTVTKD